MQKMIYLKTLGIVCLAAILLVMGFHLSVGDFLLFLSDPFSLTVYLGVMTVLISLVILAFSLPLRLLPSTWRKWLYNAFAVGLAVAICLTFLFSLAGFVASGLTSNMDARLFLKAHVGIDRLFYIKTFLSKHLMFFIIGALLCGGLFILKVRKQIPVVVGRVEQIAVVLLVIITISLPLAFGLTHLLIPSSSKEEKNEGNNLVLMVLDAMPAYDLRHYNPSADGNVLDKIMDGGLVLRQMHTSAPHTHRFFGTLYTGRLDTRRVRDNLIGRLQRAGVAVRWMAEARPGFPDSSRGRVTNYTGLRSSLLTPDVAWLPEMLGLDYHLNMGASESFTTRIGKAVFNAIYQRKTTQFDNIFIDLLLPQLRSIRDRSDRTFTLFHVIYRIFPVPEAVFTPGQARETRQHEDLIVRKIRANDYRYTPEQEIYAERKREYSRALVASIGERLEAFMMALRQDEKLRDTTVIITADHGEMFTKGRFWHGFHPNEEILRVPFVVLNGKRSGIDDRPFSTPDLTESILDFFGVKGGMSDQALSIFKDKSHDFTASLTLPSHKHNEWFLLIMDGSTKYQVNLHPKSKGESTIYEVDNFEEKPVDKLIGSPSEITSDISLWLRRFDVNLNDVHELYRF